MRSQRLGVVVALTLALALVPSAGAGRKTIWRLERGGHAHRICAPKRVFPAGTSFITLCASTDGRHWRPVFSAELWAYYEFSPTDERGGPTPDMIEQFDFSEVAVKIRHPSSRRGSLAFNGGVAYRQGCCSWNYDNDRWWTIDGGRSWYHGGSKPSCVDPFRGGPRWFRWPRTLTPWPAFTARICVAH